MIDYQDDHQGTPENRTHHPSHPGGTLKEDTFPALGLSVTDLAKVPDVSRVSLTRVINGKAPASPDLALRLEDWLNGFSAESGLKGFLAYDL